MLMYPPGPPSHRHQISGVSSAAVRSNVTPASGNEDGRRDGLPAMSGCAGARAPITELLASAVTGGHQSSLPRSASPSASNDGQRFGTGASSSSARPSPESP